MSAALLVAVAVVFGAILGISIFYVTIRVRLTQIDDRLTRAEIRALDASNRALEFRLAVIRIGEKLDNERRKYQRMVTNLVGVIKCLLDCLDHPDNVRDINRPAITRMIQDIMDDST